jgi:hypothetical protein
MDIDGFVCYANASISEPFISHNALRHHTTLKENIYAGPLGRSNHSHCKKESFPAKYMNCVNPISRILIH